MKKIIILFLLIISITEIKAQYLLYPPQKKFYTFSDTVNTSTNKDSVLINSDLPRFQMNNFTGGWQWGVN